MRFEESAVDALREPNVPHQFRAHIDDGVLIFDHDGRLSCASQAASVFFATTPAAMVWQPPELPVPPAEWFVPTRRIRLERLPGVDAEVWLLRSALQTIVRSHQPELSLAWEALPLSAARVVAQLQRAQSLAVVAMPVVRPADLEVTGWELVIQGPQEPYQSPEEQSPLAMAAGFATHSELVCLKSCLRASAELPKGSQMHTNLLPGTLLDSDRPRRADLFEQAKQRVPCIELVDRLLVGDPSTLLPTVCQLPEQGLRLALEGTGSGRCVLETLITPAPKLVKIHRPFMRGSASDPGQQRPIRRMLKLLGSLGSRCVATGIETEEKLEVVRELGVPLGQGNSWDRPKHLQAEEQGATVS